MQGVAGLFQICSKTLWIGLTVRSTADFALKGLVGFLAAAEFFLVVEAESSHLSTGKTINLNAHGITILAKKVRVSLQLVAWFLLWLSSKTC